LIIEFNLNNHITNLSPYISEYKIDNNNASINIPSHAAFISGYYVASTNIQEHINVLHMARIQSAFSYTLTNPHSQINPHAQWVIKTTNKPVGPTATQLETKASQLKAAAKSKAIPKETQIKARKGNQFLTNATTTPANIIMVTFYNNQRQAISSPTQLDYNYASINIPSQAAFISGYYVASTNQHEHINVLHMARIQSAFSYTLTNPHSQINPHAQWVLKTSKNAIKDKIFEAKQREASILAEEKMDTAAEKIESAQQKKTQALEKEAVMQLEAENKIESAQ